MAIKSGVVSDIIQFKTTTGKFMYSLCLNDAKTRYGCKFTKPEVAIGDEVEFHYTETQNGKYTNYDVDVSTLRRKEKVAAPKAAAAVASTTAVSTNNSKLGDDAVRQVLIITQSARERAIDTLDLAVKAGIKLPITTSKGKEAPVDQLTILINELTKKFLIDTLVLVPAGHPLNEFVKTLDDELPDLADETEEVVEDSEEE